MAREIPAGGGFVRTEGEKMRWAITLFVTTVAVSGARGQGTGSDIFDRVVAVVGDRVITESQVDIVSQIQLILIGGYKKIGSARSRDFRRSALEYLVEQAVIFEEARRLAFQQIRQSEVDKAVKKFQSRFPSAAEYQSFLRTNDLDNKTLLGIFRRNLVSVKFTEDSVRLNVIISEKDIDEHLTKHGGEAPLKGKPKPEQRALARKILFKKRFDKARRNWILDLRKRTKIRILVSYR